MENKDTPKDSHRDSPVKKIFNKVNLNERQVPHSIDPALDPSNQHEHAHRFHEGHGEHLGPEIRYADVGVGGRIELESTPKHLHHAGEEVRPVPDDPSPGHQHDTEKNAHHILHEKDAFNNNLEEVPSQSSELEKNSYKSHVDVESGAASDRPNILQRFRLASKHYRWVVVLFFGLFFTAWWISIVAQDKHRHMWLIPTVLWILLMIRFTTFYTPTRYLLVWANWVWQRTFVPVRNMIPKRFWPYCEAFLTIMTVLVATFATPSTDGSNLNERAVSLLGYCVFYFGFFVFSRYKNRINWHTVWVGIFAQYVVALFVLRTKAGYDFFNWISFLARKLLSFAGDGAAFLTSADVVAKGYFIANTIPSIIFFIAFIHIWYYFGILQWCIGKFAVIFFWAMQVSGAEAVVAAASPFIGQGESAILVKPFISHMTDAELFQVLVSGFATIAGSVLAAYVNMGVNPAALITSCVMSIPASLAASKLVYPETEESLTANRVVVPEDTTEEAHNVLHAFSNGAWVGLQVGLAMITNLLCIIALVALIDALLTWFGGFWNITPDLTLEMIMGYLFYPVAYMLGITNSKDIYPVAKLLGIKMIQNEFVAYTALVKSPDYADLEPRSRMLATFALCGFSNMGSIGIQIGVLGQIAPERKGRVAQFALAALLVGTFTTYTSACAAGMALDKVPGL